MQLFNTQKILRGVETQGEIPSNRELLKTTLSIAWPSILESGLLAMVGMIDTIMVGSLGSYAIAAIGLTTQPKFIGLAAFISLNVAVSAIVARRRGENDREGANRVLMQVLLLTVGLTMLVSVLCVTFAPWIIRLAGSAPDTHNDAVTYFRIIMGAILFNTISLVINAAQRGAGNTKITMRTNMVSNLVNMCFNYLLIGGKFGFPQLGVRGAAIATVLGAMVACIMSIRSVLDPDGFIFFQGFSHAKFDRRTLKSIANIGSSTLVEQIFVRIGFLAYSMIVAHLGTTSFAAHQIGLNLITLSFAFGDGLAVVGIALVGRSLGEKRPDLAKIYGSICQRMAVLFSAGLAVIFLTLGPWIFSLFSKEELIISYGRMILPLMALITFFQITAVIYSGCLRCAGDTVYVAVLSFISVAVIRPFAGWLFCYPLGMGLVGAWIGLSCDQAMRFLLSWLRFRSGKWLNYKI